jgi:hypothetical protein
MVAPGREQRLALRKRLRCRCREHELSAIGICTPRSTRASIPNPLRRPLCWTDAVQPAPLPYPNGSATQQLRVQAKVGRLVTGKAASTRIAEHSPVMWVRNAEEAADGQRQYIHK